jgi:hypothetical protein
MAMRRFTRRDRKMAVNHLNRTRMFAGEQTPAPPRRQAGEAREPATVARSLPPAEHRFTSGVWAANTSTAVRG